VLQVTLLWTGWIHGKEGRDFIHARICTRKWGRATTVNRRKSYPWNPVICRD
jgi:hypothetical protein